MSKRFDRRRAKQELLRWDEADQRDEIAEALEYREVCLQMEFDAELEEYWDLEHQFELEYYARLQVRA